MSALHLANIVFIHFSSKDLTNNEDSLNELYTVMKNVYEADASVSICILLRDTIESKVLSPDEYPKQLKDPSIKYMIDGVIQVKNLKRVEAAHAKL